MNFPQVALLWWDESKANSPEYFYRPLFSNIINGELVLVHSSHGGDSCLIQPSFQPGTKDFIANKANLIFLGEL